MPDRPDQPHENKPPAEHQSSRPPGLSSDHHSLYGTAKNVARHVHSGLEHIVRHPEHPQHADAKQGTGNPERVRSTQDRRHLTLGEKITYCAALGTVWLGAHQVNSEAKVLPTKPEVSARIPPGTDQTSAEDKEDAGSKAIKQIYKNHNQNDDGNSDND